MYYGLQARTTQKNEGAAVHRMIRHRITGCKPVPHTKKREATSLLTSPLLGGGYLLSHFRSTIGVVRLNFSVRNGKRWDPHAITTLSLPFSADPGHWHGPPL